MQPDPATVLRRRHAALVAIRAAAVLLALAGVVVVGLHLVRLTKDYIGFDMWSYRAAVIAGAVLFGVPAGALALLSARLARWIVPGPLRGCPTCGYDTASITSGVCPECGARFDDAGAGAAKR